MAQFDANINLRLNARQVERDLKKIEDRVQKLNARVESVNKRNAGPASNLTTGRQADAVREIAQLERQRLKTIQDQVKVKDAVVEKEIRLSAAAQRQATILKAINRAGGAATASADARVKSAVAASKEAKNNLSIQNSVNVLLEKELQIRRENNRLANAADIARVSGRSRGDRLEQLRASGAFEESQIKKLITLNAQYIDAAVAGQADIAKAVDRRVRRELESIEKTIKRLQSAGGPVSPIGGSATSPGSPKAEIKTAREQEKLEKSLLALKTRGVSALDKELNIQTRITNQVKLQEQAAKRAQLQGQSMRIPTPYATAGAKGFPVALPSISQDRKIAARVQQQDASKRALALQQSNSLLTKGVTTLRAQVAIAQQLDGVYDEIVRKLQRANARQGQLFRARANRAQRQELGSENLQRAKKINNLTTNRVLKEELKNKAFAVGAALKNNEFNAAKKLGKEIDGLLKAEDARIDRARRLVSFRKKERQEAKNRRKQLGEDLKLGAGFPLLFGGGAGAVGGGVLGALAGGGKGGFGSQILFSAIGQQFDAAMQRLNSLAATLGETGNIFEGLEQAGFKVSGSLKNVVNDLEEAGNASVAYAIQLQELEKVYGKRGATDLANLERGNQRLANSFKRLNAVLFAPLIPLATAISNITSGAITQLSRLFEFIAGDPASRAATPDFRLEGEFAQASGIDRQIFERSGRSREARKKAVEEQRKLIDSFNSASKAQARVNNQRRQGAQQIKKIELDIKGIAAERAQIEANSLRNQLRLQAEIRNIELTRRLTTLKAENSFKNLEKQLGQLQLSKLREFGGSEEQIVEAFGNIARANDIQIDQFGDSLSEVFAVVDQGTRLELFPKGKETIKELKAEFAGLIDIMQGVQRRDFETVPEQMTKAAIDQVQLLEAQLRVEEAVTTEIKRQAELELLKLQLRQSSPKLEEQNPNLFAQIVELRQRLANPPSESNETIVKKRVDELQSEISEMTKLGNVAVKVADNIGAAFSTAFQDVINGSKSTQQALSDMFRTIGENFIAMAADIIAHQIQMIILQTILKALGAVAGASAGGGGGAASKAGSQINVSPGPDAFKGGSFFASPSDPLFAPPTLIAGQANGGPVEGGRPYMVGERGPEMFIPGSSGGIMRNEDMRQLMGRSPAGANAPQMNFTFETTNIGGTEFVSREQLEVAMATTRRQAASDGAKQGMSMTLDKMQNSPRTRSRVGIR